MTDTAYPDVDVDIAHLDFSPTCHWVRHCGGKVQWLIDCPKAHKFSLMCASCKAQCMIRGVKCPKCGYQRHDHFEWKRI